jgi:type VII secretion-associated serine protease mycosin
VTLVSRLTGSVLGVVVVSAAVLLPVTSASADSIRGQQWQLGDLNIAQAHRITEGAGVTVAVLDTGVEAKHRDLTGAVLPGIDLIAGTSGDGRSDHDGHGTEMAGVIAGRGHGSDDGVLGIAPQAKILPVEAPTNSPTSSSFMTKAVDFAIAQHVGVINMSFGMDDDAVLHDAIRKALAADIVVVAASGNKGEVAGSFPGKYPEVLTVGASGRDGKVAPFSVTGPQVDLVAPGVDIITTANSSAGYFKSQGTSESTAVVSGAAALLRAKFPDLSAAEIVHRLTSTADDAGPKGRDDTYGYGRLDVVKALTADVAPLPSTDTRAGQSSAPQTSLAEPDDLPSAGTPLQLVGIVVGVLVLVGLIVIAVVVVRRRRTG